MFRQIKLLRKVSLGVKSAPNVRPGLSLFLINGRLVINDSNILTRFYTSKNDPPGCDSKKPKGATKSVSECTPEGPVKHSSSTAFKKGRTITPTECKQTSKKDDVPVYNKDCERPHLDTCTPQPPKHQPECRPGGVNVPPRLHDCGKRSMMDKMPQPGSWEESYKKRQRNVKLFMLLGALFAAGGLYKLWSMNYFGTNEKPVKEEKKTEKKEKKKSRWPVVPPKVPASSNDIPNNVTYLLIGGGTASFAAFRAIKSSDPKAQVLVIGDEPFFPHMRPPLSKEMWYSDDRSKVEKFMFKQWNGTERSLFYEPPEFYTDCRNLLTSKNGGVAIARGWNVSKINVNKRVVYLEDGKEIQYEKCLIATGAIPKNLPVFEQASKEIKNKVSVFRDIYSFENLEDVISDGAQSVAIVGGGFLGSELACALARRGKKQGLKVYQIFKEKGNMAKVLPEYLCKWTTEKVKNEGVEIVANAEVDDVKLVNGQVSVGLTNGKTIKADHVIVAVGVEPNTKLADSESGLEVDPDLGGFLVNAELEARTDLYVAGDCACFYDVQLGRRRVEHHDHAVVSGRLAGENMAGASKPYTHQSMFWSDLGPDVGYEAIGIVDSSLNTVGVYAKVSKDEKDKKNSDDDKSDLSKSDDSTRSDKPDANQPGESDSDKSEGDEEDYNKGVIFYLQNGVIVGMVLWNVFNRMQVARQVLKENKKYEDLNEVAKLFKIHED